MCVYKGAIASASARAGVRARAQGRTYTRAFLCYCAFLGVCISMCVFVQRGY